jgi:HD-GYP domain-containing protein (c-di-GMP phosphodiesterase class II)
MNEQISTSISADIHARIADALAKIGACARTVGQYGPSHPLAAEMVEHAHQALAELMVVQPSLVVAAADSYLALDSFPIEDSTGCLAGLAALLHERKVSEIKISAGVTCREVLDSAETIAMTPEGLALRGGMGAELKTRGVVNIQTRSGVLPVESREARDPADIYEETLVLVEEAMKAVQLGLAIPVPEIRSAVADSLRSLIQDDSALLALAGIRSYDRYLSEHSVNVCILSMVLGKDLGLDPASTLELGISALLHDVGKVFVPADVLTKPGKLSEEEWQQIRRHPAEGARALAGLPDLPALASTIALEHHSRCDGSGYPSLPPTQTPHLLSRLVAVVDAYDALTTDRPYRERWTPQQAIAWMLYDAAGQFDRQLMARFASRARLYPIGSLVRLAKGDYAVVVGGSYRHPRRPTLRVVTGAHPLSTAPALVDLSANTDPALEIDTMAQPVEVLLPYADKLIAA